jgi:hypothetical protein
MTPKEAAALARRVVACPRWRWMPGMRWIVEVAGGQSLGDRSGLILTEWDAVDDGGRVFRFGHPAMLPDLSDPATLGCLLALVREAWCDAEIAIVRERDLAWIVCHSLCNAMLYDGRYIRGSTEAEALVAALEAAP